MKLRQLPSLLSGPIGNGVATHGNGRLSVWFHLFHWYFRDGASGNTAFADKVTAVLAIIMMALTYEAEVGRWKVPVHTAYTKLYVFAAIPASYMVLIAPMNNCVTTRFTRRRRPRLGGRGIVVVSWGCRARLVSIHWGREGEDLSFKKIWKLHNCTNYRFSDPDPSERMSLHIETVDHSKGGGDCRQRWRNYNSQKSEPPETCWWLRAPFPITPGVVTHGVATLSDGKMWEIADTDSASPCTFVGTLPGAIDWLRS